MIAPITDVELRAELKLRAELARYGGSFRVDHITMHFEKFRALVLDTHASASRETLAEIMPALYKAWPHAEDMADGLEGVIGLIEQLTRERDDALAALKPFAEKADGWETRHPTRGYFPARAAMQVTHRLGDFRQAREVRNRILGEP